MVKPLKYSASNNLAPESLLVVIYPFWGHQKYTRNSRCNITDTYSCTICNCTLVIVLCSSPDNSFYSHLVNWTLSWVSGTALSLSICTLTALKVQSDIVHYHAETSNKKRKILGHLKRQWVHRKYRYRKYIKNQGSFTIKSKKYKQPTVTGIIL